MNTMESTSAGALTRGLSSCRSMGDPAEVLAKLLGGPVKCYVPRCVLLELKGLGKDFSGQHGNLLPAAAVFSLLACKAPGALSVRLPVQSADVEHMRTGATRIVCIGTETHGAARKAGLHLACGHDDKALPPSDCILSNIGADSAASLLPHACSPTYLQRACGRSQAWILQHAGIHREADAQTVVELTALLTGNLHLDRVLLQLYRQGI